MQYKSKPALSPYHLDFYKEGYNAQIKQFDGAPLETLYAEEFNLKRRAGQELA